MVMVISYVLDLVGFSNSLESWLLGGKLVQIKKWYGT